MSGDALGRINKSLDGERPAAWPRLAYRVREAAALVGLSERAAWRLVATGEWRSVKAGSATLIPALSLDAWLAAKLAEDA